MEMTLSDGRTLEYLTFGDREGVPVVLFHGTPATAGCGVLVDGAAAASGVRLIAVSRPGYGASTVSPPGLAAVARDTVELLDVLGLGRVGVHGISGGGPFALALAAVVPDRVAGAVVSAGPGSYADLGGLSPAEDAAVARAQGGDHDAAWRTLQAEAVEQFGDADGMNVAEFQAHVFPAGPPPRSHFDGEPERFRSFVTDMHRAVRRVDGYVRDHLSYCGTWDIDLTSVASPVLLVYGREDRMVPQVHGEWLDARLPHSQLHLRAGSHGHVTFGLAADAYDHLVETRGELCQE